MMLRPMSSVILTKEWVSMSPKRHEFMYSIVVYTKMRTRACSCPCNAPTELSCSVVSRDTQVLETSQQGRQASCAHVAFVRLSKDRSLTRIATFEINPLHRKHNINVAMKVKEKRQVFGVGLYEIKIAPLCKWPMCIYLLFFIRSGRIAQPQVRECSV